MPTDEDDGMPLPEDSPPVPGEDDIGSSEKDGVPLRDKQKGGAQGTVDSLNILGADRPYGESH